VADNGKFGKVTGTARLEQLLDAAQQSRLLADRNEIADRLPDPPDSHLAQLPEFLIQEYLRPFRQADRLDPVFWMRFRSQEDLAVWCPTLRAVLPISVDRVESLDPREFVRQRCWPS
jgi:hypothetical protein